MNEGFLNIMLNTLTGFNTYSVVFRILLAAIFGGAIGFERGQHGRAAGLRTHMLVCVGSTVTVLSGLYAAVEMGFNSDPMRVSAQVISGIGFLGAGTILTRNESQVTGLTTAAGLWTTACIGIAVGLGFYWASIAAFVVVIVSITILTKLELGQRRRTGNAYYFEVSDVSYVNDFCDIMARFGEHMQIISAKSGIANHVGIICFMSENGNNFDLISQIRDMRGIAIVVPMT